MSRAGEHEAGSVTLWIVGLCMAMFLLGGISLDLWRAFSERRALAAAADAAALAGASALDESAYHTGGAIMLVPSLAEARARASIAAQEDTSSLRAFEVHATTDAVSVVVRGQVGLSLLDLLQTADVDVRVTATATPRRSA